METEDVLSERGKEPAVEKERIPERNRKSRRRKNRDTECGFSGNLSLVPNVDQLKANVKVTITYCMFLVP